MNIAVNFCWQTLFNVGVFFCEVGPFLFSYLWWSYHFRKERVVYVIYCKGVRGKIREWGMSQFLSLIGSAGSFKKKYFRKSVNLKEFTVQMVFTIPADKFYLLPILQNDTFTWILHYAHDYTYTHNGTHSETDAHALFLQDPADAAENSRVGLSGKQTVRGCWESSLGLQIIVRLTKVSEPAPLLPHTHTVYTHPHNMHMRT